VKAKLDPLKAFFLFLLSALIASAADVRVVVWDEQQPRQKLALENFLGNAFAGHLKMRPGAFRHCVIPW